MFLSGSAHQEILDSCHCFVRKKGVLSNYRLGFSGREVLLVAGGFNGSHLLTSVELWSPDGQCNLELPDLPDGPRYGLGVFTYDGKVYACGGAHSR